MNSNTNNPNNQKLFPVFRFDLDNRITFANGPAQTLLGFWNCGLNQKIPANVINRYPELFHSTLSHKPMDLTIKMDQYSIRFSIVPFPEAGYIGMYAYCMEQHSDYVHSEIPIQEQEKVTR